VGKGQSTFRPGDVILNVPWSILGGSPAWAWHERIRTEASIAAGSRSRISRMPLLGRSHILTHYERVPTDGKLDCALIVTVAWLSS
jgi:hypothetical protein